MDKLIENHSGGSASSIPPPGIKILAVLHVISAGWRLFQENKVLGYAINYHFADEKVTVYAHPITLLLLENVPHIVILASGIGLWRRTKWGWWSTGFVYSFVVIRNIGRIVLHYMNGDQLQQIGLPMDNGPYVFQIAVFVLLIAYLYSRAVLELFRLNNVGKVKCIGIQSAAAILALVVSELTATAIILNQGTHVPYSF